MKRKKWTALALPDAGDRLGSIRRKDCHKQDESRSIVGIGKNARVICASAHACKNQFLVAELAALYIYARV